jgi:uncharacterized protein YkwD
MANVSPEEQLMLELVNRARMDPAAEAARFGMTLNQGLPANTISATPKQALAMNDDLAQAAFNHSEYMHLNDSFSHTEQSGKLGFTGVNPGNRIIAAGYTGATSQGENISGRFYSGGFNLASSITLQHEDLFRSTSGHRQNLLLDAWREVGIGQSTGSFNQDGTEYNSSMVTQNFAYRGSQYFLTGVVYQDTVVNNDFYTVNEGTGGVQVRAGINNVLVDTTSVAGGYEAALNNGTYNIHIGVANFFITIASRNVKVDFVNGNQLWTDSSLTAISGAADIRLLGATNANLTGAGAAEQLVGNRGNNVLSGMGANDTLFGMDGNDTLIGGPGADAMNGGNGNDTYNLGSEVGDTISDPSGVDVVLSTIARSIGPYATVENLILQGAAAINGVGNALNNTILGNNANNVLTGAGGQDTLQGLLGNDIYNLENGTDSVIDTGGIDGITSTINRDLNGYGAIENLYLQGAGNINGFGNALNNFIQGGAGRNVLQGRAGNDTLDGAAGLDSYYGQQGNDVFIFRNVADTAVGANRDVIGDFEDFADNDTINLSAMAGVTTYIGQAAFSAPGQVRAIQVGANVLVQINTVGNTATPEAEILLAQTLIGTIDPSDFML